jgi:hypothetical protein
MSLPVPHETRTMYINRMGSAELFCGTRVAFTRVPCDLNRENFKGHHAGSAKYVTATHACRRTLRYPRFPEIIEIRPG